MVMVVHQEDDRLASLARCNDDDHDDPYYYSLVVVMVMMMVLVVVRRRRGPRRDRRQRYTRRREVRPIHHPTMWERPGLPPQSPSECSTLVKKEEEGS